MTQEEWDACTNEKQLLHIFLSAMSEISGRSGKNMREAILELVADMPDELRVLPVKGFLSNSEALNCARGLVRVEPVVGPLSSARSDLPSMPPPAASLPVSAPAGVRMQVGWMYRPNGILMDIRGFPENPRLQGAAGSESDYVPVYAAMSATTKEN